jgi:hypothetical protein
MIVLLKGDRPYARRQKSLSSIPSPRQAFISLAAAASDTGLASVRAEIEREHHIRDLPLPLPKAEKPALAALRRRSGMAVVSSLLRQTRWEAVNADKKEGQRQDQGKA